MNTHSYRWTIVGIGALMTCVALGAGAFGWGALSDRYGTRLVVSIGAVLLGLAHGHVPHRHPRVGVADSGRDVRAATTGAGRRARSE